jgi:LacI family transcriptional regulator
LTGKRVTLKDIAAELGLTHPTVSRALARHRSISEETRARVEEASRRMGYVANSGARLMRSGRANVVGLLLPDITNEFYAAVAQRLADDCSRRGLQLLLSISAGDPDRELALVTALLEARPAGLIAALSPAAHAATLDHLSNILCVQFMQPQPALTGPVVTVEDSGGARQAIGHLLALGHRRIGVVGPAESTLLGEARLRGVKEALRATGQALDPELIRLGPSEAEFGSQAMEALLALPDRPTAVYLSSAPLSLGGMRQLSRTTLIVPRDISVVVAGGTAWYDAWPGGLTSVTLPSTDLADAAAAQLFQQLDDPDAAPSPNVTLSFGLCVRGSTAPPSR